MWSVYKRLLPYASSCLCMERACYSPPTAVATAVCDLSATQFHAGAFTPFSKHLVPFILYSRTSVRGLGVCSLLSCSNWWFRGQCPLLQQLLPLHRRPAGHSWHAWRAKQQMACDSRQHHSLQQGGQRTTAALCGTHHHSTGDSLAGPTTVGPESCSAGHESHSMHACMHARSVRQPQARAARSAFSSCPTCLAPRLHLAHSQ